MKIPLDTPEWLTVIVNGTVMGRIYNRGTPEEIEDRRDHLILEAFAKAARGEASPVSLVYQQMSRRLEQMAGAGEEQA